MKQFEIWLADLDPAFGTEAGKTRPVLIIQNNMLMKHGHKSTLVCPLTTRVVDRVFYMRTRVTGRQTGLKQDSDVLIDQIRAIDNKRLIRNLGILPLNLIPNIKRNLNHILDL